jgi:glycosyltransferase involved in cell wall biosynthesis
MNINYAAPLNYTGYGVAGFNILKALHELNHNISYFPIGTPAVDTKEEYDMIISMLKNQNESLDIHAPYIKIWHQFDLADHVGRGKYYAYPFFELDTFNGREKKHLNIPDEIFVSCNWAKEIIQNNGIKTPVSVVPLGVNREIFNENIPRTRLDSKYVFLTIGKWEIRKSHDLLPNIFKKAFPNQDDVELWILAAEHTSSYSNEEEITKWKQFYQADNIKVIPGVKSKNEVAELISNSDCGLYISKAEGWNLELLESMSMSKPVIATNYSAHTEYCNSENSFLVDIDNTEPAFDGKVFQRQGQWAKIDQKQIDQTIEYMRHVYNNKIVTNINGVKTAEKLSWQNSASIISRCISN